MRTAVGGCDPDAAYDPDMPCRPVAAPPVVAARPVQVASLVAVSTCDADAAYDPTRPCRPAPPAPVVAQPPAPVPVGSAGAATACDPVSAYDPTQPCRPAQPVPVVAQPPPTSPRERHVVEARPIQERMGHTIGFLPGTPANQWKIQVGAFATLSTAESAAQRARLVAPDLLQRTNIELPATVPLGTQVAFRARLSGLSAAAATEACSRLTDRGIACVTVAPPRDSF